MPAQLRIHLFGGFRLTLGEEELSPIATLKARSLFAYLAMNVGRPHTRDLLAGLFWPDLPNAKARRRLSQALWRIHQALPRAVNPLDVRKDAVGFRAGVAVWVDVHAFEAALTQGNAEGWQKALMLYGGDFLQGFYDDWVILERERLRDRYLGAIEAMLQVHKEAGRLEEALRLARLLARTEPLRENAHAEIMQLNLALGRPQEAIRQYETLRRILAAELGIAPSPAVTELYQQLKTSKPAPQKPPSAPLLDRAEAIPLVGRVHPRRRLLTALNRSIQGQGGVALVEGEPGVGKTRLLQTIAEDARWLGMTVTWAWAEEMAGQSPYALLEQLLRKAVTPLRAIQLRPLVDVVWLQTLAGFFPHLRDHWPEPASAASLSPEQQRQRLHQALAHTLPALGDIHPHLLILEDVHWADASSLDALTHLASRLSHSRVFLLLSLRREEARDREEVWRHLQNLRSEPGPHLVLPPLNEADTARLVQESLGLHQPAPRFARRLHQESGGNPLFVLEMLRALHDEGVLFRDAQGVWSTLWDDATLDYAEMPIPEGVQIIIQQRLRRLDALTRELLEAAAILGDRFGFLHLTQLVGKDVPACTRCLTILTTSRLLEEEAAGYRFTHHLVRQATLRTLSPTRKREWHARALALLRTWDAPPAAALAHHAAGAGLTEDAARYHLQAGDEARAIYANRAALQHYDAALAQTAQVPLRWQLLLRKEQVLDALAWREEQSACLLALAELARQMENEGVLAQAFLRQGQFWMRTGAPDKGIAQLQQALSLAQAAGDDRLAAAIHGALGRAYWHLGDAERSLAATRKAERIYRNLGDAEGEMGVLNLLGNLHLGLLGRYEDAVTDFRRMLKLAQELAQEDNANRARCNLAVALMALGQFQESQTLLDEAEAFFQREGYRLWLAIVAFVRGNNWLGLGNVGAARNAARRGLALCEEIGNVNFAIENLHVLGRAALVEERFAEAAELFHRAKMKARAGHQPQDTALQSSYGALALMRMGDLSTALAASQEALAAPPQDKGFQAVMHFHHYQILARARGAEAAYPHLQQAHASLMEAAQTLRNEQFRRSFLENWPAHREIIVSYEGWQRGLRPQRVRLPRVDAPTGRALTADDWREITWTPVAAGDERIAPAWKRRRHALLRLLSEAREQGAAPRVEDLARALDVSPRTLKRDLAHLRAAGHDVRTRGARDG